LFCPTWSTFACVSASLGVGVAAFTIKDSVDDICVLSASSLERLLSLLSIAVTLLLAPTEGDEAVLPMFIAARSAPICSMRPVSTYHASIYECENGRGDSRPSARCAPSMRTMRLFMDAHVGDHNLLDAPQASIYGCACRGIITWLMRPVNAHYAYLFTDAHVGDHNLVYAPRKVELLNLGLDPRGCKALWWCGGCGDFVKIGEMPSNDTSSRFEYLEHTIGGALCMVN
jgi:hypothetical protein